MKQLFFIFLFIISSNELLAQNTSPVPKFNFLVNIGGVECSFEEVSGLDIQSEEIKYRHGDSPSFSVIKMPGIIKVGNVTLKKGIANNNLLGLIAKAKTNNINRTPVTIKLMDENGEPTMTWVLTNAWIVKSVLSKNKSIIESVEVVHEGLSILNGK